MTFASLACPLFYASAAPALSACQSPAAVVAQAVAAAAVDREECRAGSRMVGAHHRGLEEEKLVGAYSPAGAGLPYTEAWGRGGGPCMAGAAPAVQAQHGV